jgi:hypothetical protein
MCEIKNFSAKRLESIVDLAMFFGKLQPSALTYNDKYQLERFICFLEVGKDWSASEERQIINNLQVEDNIKSSLEELSKYVNSIANFQSVDDKTEQYENLKKLLASLKKHQTEKILAQF